MKSGLKLFEPYSMIVQVHCRRSMQVQFFRSVLVHCFWNVQPQVHAGGVSR
jgi:hypothetical protein